MDRYGQGVLYVWTLPDNFNDLYRLPPKVLSAIKRYVLAGFPVSVAGPSQVALFAYDNNTFIVESYLGKETDVKVGVSGECSKLRNLVTGEVIVGQRLEEGRGRWRRPAERITFDVHLLPHSYLVFSAEK